MMYYLAYLLCSLGSVVIAFTDDDNTLKAIYFQASEMKSAFESYPEMLIVDATYKLNDLNMPLYVLIIMASLR